MLEIVLSIIVYFIVLFLIMKLILDVSTWHRLSTLRVKRLLKKEESDLININITHSEMGDEQMVYASYKGKFIVFRKKNNTTYVSLHTYPTPTYLGNAEALIAYLSLLTNKTVKAVYTPN